MEFKNFTQARKITKISYLGKVDVSAKIMKNLKVFNQSTYSLYLAPAKLSGYNTCSHSTPECRMGCLNTSGRAGMEVLAGKTMTADCRNRRTKLFYENNEFFMQWLIAEITSAYDKAKSLKRGFSIRLNCTSDIDWANVYYKGKNIFEMFPTVDFYDYTKNPAKFINKPENYHLTFSYTGRNWNLCEMVLQGGGNVAMVFNLPKTKNNPLPTKYKGYDVIDGDISDYRIADKKGVIVGLYWKVIGNAKANETVKNSCFCIQPKDFERDCEVKVTENIEAI